MVALGGPGCDANELPRRSQPVRHQNEAVEEKIRFAHPAVRERRQRDRIDLFGGRVDLVAIENTDVIGQPPGKIGKHVA